MPEGEQPGGVFAALARMGQTVLALAEIRFQLFTSELESEKLRFLDTLVKLAIALAVAGMGLAMATLTLALYIWKVAGYPGLLVLALIFLLVGVGLILRMRNELSESPPPFEKTLNEFKKDRACSIGED